MKRFTIIAFLALIIGCSPQEHLEVKAIDILPPGGDVDEVTAYVDLQGAGIARLDWEHRAYGVDSLVQTEYWYVDSSDVYTSTLSVTDGWYWLSIYDEDSVLLAASDVVFCGTGSQLPPIAKFYAEPTSGEVRLQVVFYDQSLNDPTSYLWKLEGIDIVRDSAYSTCKVEYEQMGTYDATLIVSNIAGTDTLIKKDYIYVEKNPNPPIADFYAELTEGENPLIIKFYNQSTSSGFVIQCQWDFGDGTPLNTKGGIYDHWHTYEKSGIFTVILIITDTNGADTLTREDYIHVTEP